MGRDRAPDGFTDFVVARGPALHRTAYLLTRNHASAEDLVQTALAKAWRAWHRLDAEPEAYVRRILVNEFASSWRRKWRGEVPSEHLPEPGHAVGTGDHADAVTTRQLLLDVLATLPPRQRAVVVLRYFHDYSEAMVAQTLGISVGTVKSQHARALAALRIDDAFTDNPRSHSSRTAGKEDTS